MPDERRERYLASLEGLLPMPDGRRAEVLEEIDAHLDDAVADAVERGIPADRAEEDAQARLGAARDLARELAKPDQSTWRVFAGVGAAIRSGIGWWVYGYLLGSIVIVAAAIALTMLVQAAGSVFGTGWSLQFSDQGWNTMLTSIGAAVGLYFAGRVIPDRFGRSSRRLAIDVRPWTIGAATAIALVLTTLVVDVPQNWASVAVLVLAPGALALGAYRPDLLPLHRRFSVLGTVLVFLLIGALGVSLAGSATGQVGGEVIDEFPDRGLSAVGPEWRPAVDDPWAPALATSNWGTADGEARWEGELASGVSLSGFRDLRLEAWRSTDNGMRLDLAYREPFAVAPVERAGRSLAASIDTAAEPGVVSWDLILTGVRDDGVRYVIDASTGGQSTFTGSVWDWMVAVSSDR